MGARSSAGFRWRVEYSRIVTSWSIVLIVLMKSVVSFTQEVDYFGSCDQEFSVTEEDPIRIVLSGDQWTKGNSCSLVFAATEIEDDLYITFKEFNISNVCDTVSFEVDTRSKYIFFTKRTIYDCSYKPFVGPIADRWERYTRLRVTRNSTEDTNFRIVVEITTFDLPDIVFPQLKMTITEGTIASVVIGVVGFVIIVGVTAFIVALARTKKEKPTRNDRTEVDLDSTASGDMML